MFRSFPLNMFAESASFSSRLLDMTQHGMQPLYRAMQEGIRGIPHNLHKMSDVVCHCVGFSM